MLDQLDIHVQKTGFGLFLHTRSKNYLKMDQRAKCKC